VSSLSKYRGDAPSLPKHKHCSVCGNPIDLSKDYCSDKCRVAAKKTQRARTRNFVIITGAVFAFYIAFLLLQGRF